MHETTPATDERRAIGPPCAASRMAHGPDTTVQTVLVTYGMLGSGHHDLIVLVGPAPWS